MLRIKNTKAAQGKGLRLLQPLISSCVAACPLGCLFGFATACQLTPSGSEALAETGPHAPLQHFRNPLNHLGIEIGHQV